MKLSHSIAVLTIFASLFVAALWFGPLAEAQSFLVPKKESTQETTGGYRGVIAPRKLKEGEETKKQATRPTYRIKKHVARRDSGDQRYNGVKSTTKINRQYQTQSGLRAPAPSGRISRGNARLEDIKRLREMGFDVRSYIPRPSNVMTAADNEAYIAEKAKEEAKIKRLRRALRKIDGILNNHLY